MSVTIAHRDERPGPTDVAGLLPPMLNADALIVFTRAGSLSAQVAVHGMSKERAASALRHLADGLERNVDELPHDGATTPEPR